MLRRTLKTIISVFALLGIMTLAFTSTLPVRAQSDAVVRAVFFYSPTCSHCHYVMTEVFPDIRAQYGDQLEIMFLNTSSPANSALFGVALEMFQPTMNGVPLLIVGDKVMVGSGEIPDQFAGYIDAYLAEGGVDWPELPGLDKAVPDDEYAASQATVQEIFNRDPVGNSLSVVVLVALVVALFAVLSPRKWQLKLAAFAHPEVFLLVLAIGLAAAMYLTYVEVTQTEAICGPVGDCNAVQQSKFALLFGFMPMALFGLLGYLAILATWLYEVWIKGKYSEWMPGVRFAMTLFGLAFSIWLTFLEPFVIGATCAWCLTSAISMMLLTLFSAGPGWRSPLFPKPKRRY